MYVRTILRIIFFYEYLYRTVVSMYFFFFLIKMIYDIQLW